MTPPNNNVATPHLTQNLAGIGGEALALAADYKGSESFRSAGYVPVTTNSSYEGGVVKQSGGFSFIRVFQSGHAPALFQPETTYQIFMRAMFHNDIATGKQDLTKNTSYVSEGPSDSWGWTDTLPGLPENDCNLWWSTGTCTPEQIAAVAAGTATINEFMFVSSPGGDEPLPFQIGNGNGSTSGNSSGTTGGEAASGTSNNGVAGALSQCSLVTLTVLVGVSFFVGVY